LTDDPTSPDRPGYWYGLAYSPDGTRIVYSRGGDLWLMDADGAHQHRLDAGRERACASVCSLSRRFTPSWAPDGWRLAYTTALNSRSRYRGEQLLRVNVLDLGTQHHHVVGDLTVTGSNPPVWWSNDELLVRPVLGR